MILAAAAALCLLSFFTLLAIWSKRVKFYCMPLFWLFFSWIILQCLSVFGIVRPLRTRFNKILRLLVVGAVVLYAIFMLPYFVFLMKSFFLTLLSRQNHASGGTRTLKTPRHPDLIIAVSPAIVYNL